MARVIPGGRSRYPSEARVLEFLQNALPNTYLLDICRKLPIGKFNEYREIDLIVIAPHAIYLLEIKNFHGTITGDRDTWQLWDGTTSSTVQNPLRNADYNAQSLKTFLADAIPALKSLLWVQALVVLSSDRVQIRQLPEDVARQVCTLATLVGYLTNPALIPGRRGGGLANLQPYYTQIEAVLKGSQTAPGPGSGPSATRAPTPAAAPPPRQVPNPSETKARPGIVVSIIVLLVLIVGCWQGFRWISGVVAGPPATLGGLSTPALPTNAPPTAAPAPSATDLAGANQIRPGSVVVVVNISGTLNGRREPSKSSPVVASFPESARLQVLDGPVQADGYVWWKVQGDAGTGWSATGPTDGTTWLQVAPN